MRIAKNATPALPSSSSTGSMVETSSGGGCSARRASSAFSPACSSVSAARIWRLAACSSVTSWSSGSSLERIWSSVTTASSEPSASRASAPGAGLSTLRASIVTSTERPAAAAASTTASSVSVE